MVCREWAWASHGSQRRRTQGGPSSAAACCRAGWGAPRKPRPARRSQEGGSLGSRAWLCSRIGGPPGLEQWEKDLGWASWGGSRPAPRSLWALCPGTSHVGSTGRPSPSRAAAPPCHLRVPVSSRGALGGWAASPPPPPPTPAQVSARAASHLGGGVARSPLWRWVEGGGVMPRKHLYLTATCSANGWPRPLPIPQRLCVESTLAQAAAEWVCLAPLCAPRPRARAPGPLLARGGQGVWCGRHE